MASPVRRLVAGRGRTPVRLLIAPQDIRTADPTAAADIYSGYFVFQGKAVNTHGRSPFGLPVPSTGWAEALSSFGWLRHLRAADTPLARANARALVDDWITLLGRPRPGPAWLPRIATRRLLAWLSQSPLILEGADAVFYRRFMRSLARHVVVLRHALRSGLEGEGRLFAAVALTEAGLCAEGLERLQRQATRLLVAEIRAQILPDGGHVSRNPGVLVDLLLDLLPLRQAFVAAGVAVPAPLNNAIDRMIPMLRTFRHGDGTLALFNGMRATRADALATILAHDDTAGRPLSAAPASGYQRLEIDDAVVLVDAGRPPPIAYAGQAHAGTLAFEFSVGTQRIVINCGVPATRSAATREAVRATAAHSTLVAGGRSSSRFAPMLRLGVSLEGVLFAGPRRVPVKRTEDGDGVAVEASHDGYRAAFGFDHRRVLRLATGGRLEGRDALVATRSAVTAAAPGFELRFHLHHALRPRPGADARSVRLAFPDGTEWVFEAGGLPVAIEESIVFAGRDGARRSEQLVVRGRAGDPGEVAWSFSPPERKASPDAGSGAG